jgi:hypothetical protein
MHNIQHVSFPRSGYYITVKCLRGILPGMIHRCEFYNHCRQTPCTDPKTNYQKNHDLHLRLKQVPQFHYIIQYRHPIESIASWYVMNLEHARPIKKLFLSMMDSEKLFKIFFLQKINFWKRFVQKWIIGNRSNNTHFISYHELLKNPVDVLLQTAQFIHPFEQVSRSAVEKVVAEQNITIKHQLADFRYYDTVFFGEIEDSIEEYLRALNLMRVIDN